MFLKPRKEANYCQLCINYVLAQNKNFEWSQVAVNFFSLAYMMYRPMCTIQAGIGTSCFLFPECNTSDQTCVFKLMHS